MQKVLLIALILQCMGLYLVPKLYR